jgi:arginyl-tRNA synthetase
MQEISNLLKSSINELFNIDIEPEITRPEEQFGDYSTNVSMQLGGKLKEVNIASPGFINIKLNDEALAELMNQTPVKIYEGKTVVAEYSDPNPFKVLHAGHLYTTILGDVIANLAENAGAKVHRVNFGGDVGLHVGKAMWAIIKELGGENPDALEQIPKEQRLEWISARYVEGSAAYEGDEEAKHAIQEMNKRVYQIHEQKDHDSPFAQIYWTCRTWSYEGFDDLYQKLQVKPFEKYYPESETTELGVKTVQEQLEKGIFEKSDGATVYKGEKDGLHTRVFITKQGLPTYEAKDLGLALTKWQDYHFDLSIIITANDIEQYMKVLLAALAHIQPELPKRTRHLTHGIVKLSGGIKMSSRLGNILRAQDILDSAAQANKKQSKQENYETVLAAVKYAFIKNKIGADIIYDPEESVAVEGNSGPYLQYAHARARNILAKAADAKQLPKEVIFDESERSLVRKIGEYNESVEKATNELMPHYIATYLYELAQTFNRFYEKSRVIEDERENVRLSLVNLYANTLKKGLELLNITAPDKM